MLLPKTISFFWNNSSSLGLIMAMQIFTGLFLTFHFGQSFDALIFYMRDTIIGSKLRFFHANGASFFLFFIYVHFFRGMYFLSYNKKNLWVSGCLLLLLSMSASFLGYVLPYSQMSYWSATVIVNLISVIPYIGYSICVLLWGAYTVNSYTLKRFFTLHFLLPFVVLILVFSHLLLLHNTSSNSSFLGVSRKSFFKLFFVKDLISWTFYFLVFLLITHLYMNQLSDVENFLTADPLITPLHIKPEWYFLFAYSILRCIPSKSFSVFSLVLSVIFPIFCIFSKNKYVNSNLPAFCVVFFLLTMTGSMPVEDPYVLLSQLLSLGFFILFVF